MDIVYFTKGDRGSVCLSTILKKGYAVKAVIGVVPEEAINRLSDEYGFPVLFLDKINSPEAVLSLKEFNADLFVLCGYNMIIKQQVIEIPPLGTINLHGGKLPDFRGAAPINWQIIHGETTGGCAIIYVDEGIDTGDIIAQEIYPITAEDTHASVLKKTLEIFPRLLVEVLEQIRNGTVNPVPQDPDQGGYYGRRYPHDSLIEWESMTDVQVHNLIRAMHGPYPSAYTFQNGIKVEIEKSSLLDDSHLGTPGSVSQIVAEGVIVQASNRGLLIKEINVAGEELAPADFFEVGEQLINDQEEDIDE
jgi:methionyl-tRNA formyltransferase